MNATLLQPRTDDQPEKWFLIESGEMVHIWIEKDGIHTQRFGRSSKGRPLDFQEMVITFDDMVSQAEGQLKFF